MTLEQIFAKINSHMIKGLMVHEQLANYYDFLCLEGYTRCHEYHYLCESLSFRSLNRYYVNHHNKLIPEEKVENPDIIPSSWYRYERQDVDTNTKRNAVKNGVEIWVNWETETKKLYEQMYKELINIDEVASACKIKELICDVDKELKMAQRHHINKMSADYNILDIVEEQDCLHEKYKKKIEKVGVKVC